MFGHYLTTINVLEFDKFTVFHSFAECALVNITFANILLFFLIFLVVCKQHHGPLPPQLECEWENQTLHLLCLIINTRKKLYFNGKLDLDDIIRLDNLCNLCPM